MNYFRLNQQGRFDFIQAIHGKREFADRRQIAGFHLTVSFSGQQAAVYRSGLRGVFDAANRAQAPSAAQRIIRQPVATGGCDDPGFIPFEYFVQQAHGPGVREQRAELPPI
ncbi:hypothetical protein sS8_2912 [Methylocaldum marinum]|uniref:Uncharacterized protein n=1 Tax=Methylocaldum marinum TaxID=1432792 RepID=A0A250KTB6_9GAMM|nr:hypothetical protein sS8_2912 [Methylocaldum marinum]